MHVREKDLSCSAIDYYECREGDGDGVEWEWRGYGDGDGEPGMLSNTNSVLYESTTNPNDVVDVQICFAHEVMISSLNAHVCVPTHVAALLYYHPHPHSHPHLHLRPLGARAHAQ